MIWGGAAGGLYAALMGVNAYNMVPVANFIALTAYAGGSSNNFIQGVISGIGIYYCSSCWLPYTSHVCESEKC